MSQMATQGINHCITSEIPEGPVKFAFSLYLPESSYVYFTYIMPRFFFFFFLYLVGGIRESMSAPSSQKWKFLNIFKYIHILFYLGFSTYGKGLTWSVVKNLPANAGEKEMATHSSILAWGILWTEELSRLQFVGSQKGWPLLND